MRLFALLAVLGLAACSDSRGGTYHPTSGSDAGNVKDGGDGGLTDPCSAAAKLVWVVDANGTISNFNPLTKQFVDKGVPSCLGSQDVANAMGIDRNATAWLNVVSDSDMTYARFYKLDTDTLACQDAGYNAGTGGFVRVGMGFSSNASGSNDETLFVAGNYPTYPNTNNKLATLDTTTMQTHVIGSLPSWPDLTGTGSAELWGFFPVTDNNPHAKIAQIDKTNAQLVPSQTYMLSQLDGGTAVAWGFAFWGGDFYLFLWRDGNDQSTHVWHVWFPETGVQMEDITGETGREIVGAGVSSCAPITIG